MANDLFLGLAQGLDPRNIFSISYELKELSTYKVGGQTSFYAKIFDFEGLLSVSNFISENEIPVLVVGNGSNLLIADSGFDGLVIQLGETFAQIEIEEKKVTAGGSTSLPVLARRTVQAGLSGFEWAVGVPGSVGGAVRMNAGGHGASISDSLLSAEIFNAHTKEKRVATRTDLEMNYRSTSVLRHEVVLKACFTLDNGSREEGEERISEIIKWRRENQPGGHNAGSVFMNPPDDSAGRLIEEAGLKGYRVGSAQVSEKHANFIQVEKNGSADDIYQLMIEVKSEVEKHAGISLQTETIMIGFD